MGLYHTVQHSKAPNSEKAARDADGTSKVYCRQGHGHTCPKSAPAHLYAPLRPLQPCHMQKAYTFLIIYEYASLNGACVVAIHYTYEYATSQLFSFFAVTSRLIRCFCFCALRRVLKPNAGVILDKTRRIDTRNVFTEHISVMSFSQQIHSLGQSCLIPRLD
jgi:hypothetical protein